MIKRALFFILSLLPFVSAGQDIPTITISADFFPQDASVYSYPVSPRSFMRGAMEINRTNTPPQKDVFYLHGELRVDSILSGGKKLDYESKKVLYRYDYSRVAVKTQVQETYNEDQALQIYYSGFFNPSGARSLSDYMRIDQQEGVFLRSYGYSLWFPVFLEPEDEPYKANFKNININLPAGFKAVVSGKLLEEGEKEGRYQAAWRPGYSNIRNIQCTARPWKILVDKGVHIYYLDRQSAAQQILTYVQELKTLFRNHLRQVKNTHSLYVMEMPEYGNISNDNITGISSNLFGNFEEELFPKLTIAHELVHPYVQLPLQKANPFYALFMEGFPSFFQVWALHKTHPDSVYDIQQHMQGVEARYLQKKETGKTSRGFDLPEEKSILSITADEIGNYKDKFILNDRVWLFMYDLWQKMGDTNYEAYLEELLNKEDINYADFEKTTLKYLPNYGEKLAIWLNGTKYPVE